MSEKADTGLRVNKKVLLREYGANYTRHAFDLRLCLELFYCVFLKISILSLYHSIPEFKSY